MFPSQSMNEHSPVMLELKEIKVGHKQGWTAQWTIYLQTKAWSSTSWHCSIRDSWCTYWVWCTWRGERCLTEWSPNLVVKLRSKCKMRKPRYDAYVLRAWKAESLAGNAEKAMSITDSLSSTVFHLRLCKQDIFDCLYDCAFGRFTLAWPNTLKKLISGKRTKDRAGNRWTQGISALDNYINLDRPTRIASQTVWTTWKPASPPKFLCNPFLLQLYHLEAWSLCVWRAWTSHRAQDFGLLSKKENEPRE